jgi:hypothetical protein
MRRRVDEFDKLRSNPLRASIPSRTACTRAVVREGRVTLPETPTMDSFFIFRFALRIGTLEPYFQLDSIIDIFTIMMALSIANLRGVLA